MVENALEKYSFSFKNEQLSGFLLFFIVFLSRLPFLFDGYGSEEDAWGLALTSIKIHSSGIYEYSRLPGHPFQELVYALLANQGAFVFNLCTALISSFGFLYLYKLIFLLRKSRSQAFLSSLLSSFIPIIFINSTNAMDYMWAFAFIVMSIHYLVKQNIIVSALFLAIACGCRVTSVLFIPLLFYFLYTQFKITNLSVYIKFISGFLFFSILIFSPLFYTYGFSFINFYEQNYPSFMKALYKFILAPAGLGGLLVLFGCVVYSIKAKLTPPAKTVLILSIAGIIIHSLWYWYMPQKSAFMIPALIFPCIYFGMQLKIKVLKVMIVLMFLSNFILGINLIHPNRGSNFSELGFTHTIQSQIVAIDVLHGPLIADIQKRRNKIKYVNLIAENLKQHRNPTILICGFYYAELKIQSDSTLSDNVVLTYHLSEEEIQEYQSDEFEIYFLPEQDDVNDLYFNKKFTNSYASIFPESLD